MALFRTVRNAISIPGESLQNPGGWMSRLFGMSETGSGIAINELNALGVSDFYKCDRVLRETVAMLPWKVYKINGRVREEARNHPLYFLLHDEPNDHMTSFTYREMLMSNLNIWGRHFSYIERTRGGVIKALWPIRPDLCRMQVVDGKIWFFARAETGPEQKFWDDEILYIPGLTRDGYHAYSPVMLQREALGLAKAMELFGAKFFGNGSHAGGFLEHQGNISAAAAKRLKDSIEEKHKGVDNSHRMMILEEGMKFSTNTIPPEAAQFLQSREFQRGEIAGLMRVPPHKIGDLSRSTNNNIEHQDLEFYSDSIAPWLERIEQACNRRLLLDGEKGKIFIEFDMDGMIRGDLAAQTAYNSGMFNIGAMSQNEIRAKKNLPPVDGGDRFFVPMNMVPTDKIDEQLDVDGDITPDSEPLQRIRKTNLRFFRDATGRVVNRKPSDRQKYAETAFLQPVFNLIECVFSSISDDLKLFASEFCASLAVKSPDWTAENADQIASEEVDRCLTEALSRGKN